MTINEHVARDKDGEPIYRLLDFRLGNHNITIIIEEVERDVEK